MGLVAVIVFADIFGARDSTGVVLPLLIAADLGAVSIYRQQARWTTSVARLRGRAGSGQLSRVPAFSIYVAMWILSFTCLRFATIVQVMITSSDQELHLPT